MGIAFWLRRFLLVFAVAAVVITGVQRLKGHTLDYSVTQGIAWAAIAAAVFTLTRRYRSRKGQPCALCGESPDEHSQDGVSRAADHDVA